MKESLATVGKFRGSKYDGNWDLTKTKTDFHNSNQLNSVIYSNSGFEETHSNKFLKKKYDQHKDSYNFDKKYNFEFDSSKPPKGILKNNNKMKIGMGLNPEMYNSRRFILDDLKKEKFPLELLSREVQNPETRKFRTTRIELNNKNKSIHNSFKESKLLGEIDHLNDTLDRALAISLIQPKVHKNLLSNMTLDERLSKSRENKHLLNEIFDEMLLKILDNDVAWLTLKGVVDENFKRSKERKIYETYDRIKDNVIDKLAQEVVQDYVNIEVKKYFLKRETPKFSNDPVVHVFENVITSFCEKTCEEIVKTSLAEVVIDYMIDNYFERVFFKTYIPKQLAEVVEESAVDHILSSIFGDIVENLCLEISEPISMLCIEQEMRKEEAQELEWFFDKYVERQITEQFVESIAARIQDPDLEFLADQAHIHDKYQQPNQAFVKEFQLI